MSKQKFRRTAKGLLLNLGIVEVSGQPESVDVFFFKTKTIKDKRPLIIAKLSKIVAKPRMGSGPIEFGREFYGAKFFSPLEIQQFASELIALSESEG